jgi:hypothetical protein
MKIIRSFCFAALVSSTSGLASGDSSSKASVVWMETVDRELQLELSRQVPIVADVASEFGAGMVRYPIAGCIAELFQTVPPEDFDGYLESLRKVAANKAIVDSWKNAERVSRETHQSGIRTIYIHDNEKMEIVWFQEPQAKVIGAPKKQ